MDWMLEQFPAPQLIKIDIEGMEYAALAGAGNVLKLQPTILCEVTKNNELVGKILKENGYTMYAARGSGKELTPLDQPYFDTLAYPSTDVVKEN